MYFNLLKLLIELYELPALQQILMIGYFTHYLFADEISGRAIQEEYYNTDKDLSQAKHQCFGMLKYGGIHNYKSILLKQMRQVELLL